MECDLSECIPLRGQCITLNLSAADQTPSVRFVAAKMQQSPFHRQK